MGVVLPRIAETARFVPADRLSGPCCVVDGPRLPEAVLALSHWPGSGTPEALAADTSAGIAVRYLEADPRGPAVEALTNNHFDEDGLFALWLLLERPRADDPRRALAVAAAEAGDFRTWTDPRAAQAALAAMAMAERGTTPFAAVRRALAPTAARDPAGAIYEALLPRVGRLLADPARHRLLWAPAWERVERDMALLDAGGARIDDVPEGDLAIVRAPRPLDPLAVYPRTARTRVLSATDDGRLVLEHRYETWVDYRSRRLAPRVDLAPLLPVLQAAERGPGTWRADEMWAMTPRLVLAGPDGAPAPSSLGADALARMLSDHLAAAAAA